MAVFVSGGKQYRAAPGDRLLVDRLTAAAGSELTIDRVLLVVDGDRIEVGKPMVEGQAIKARVLSHPRGPKIDVLRYKAKKRVRVHRGARADLTAIEILDIGDRLAAKAKAETKTETKALGPTRAAAKHKAEEAPEDGA